jgi:hypothetical protein
MDLVNENVEMVEVEGVLRPRMKLTGPKKWVSETKRFRLGQFLTPIFKVIDFVTADAFLCFTPPAGP